MVAVWLFVRRCGARTFLRLSVLVFTALTVRADASVATRADDLTSRLDAIAARSLGRPNSAVSIAVLRDGQTIARAYGLADRQRGVRATPDSIFHIASISKNVAAAAVLSLVDRGQLKLDDDVTKYVPAAPTHGRRVTIQQLINHTSGIFSFTSLPDAEANEARELTHEQVLALIKDRPFDFAPGTRWRYDNTGFYLAGMVVEHVSGKPYGTYVREQFFQPLGMSSSSLCSAHDEVPGLVSGYVRQKDALAPAPFMTWVLPFSAGSICATASDLLKWQAGLDSGRVLRPATLAVMRRPTALADGTRIDYGLGTRLGSFVGHRVLGHTGSGGGFTTVLEDFPNDRLTIAVLINTEEGGATTVAADIARAALGIPEREPENLPAPKTELAAIAGVFDSDEGSVHLMPCGEHLCFELADAGARQTPLTRTAPFTYAIGRDLVATFGRRNGRVEWGFVHAAGLMTDAKHRVK
jgi:D-alanyl-D-alanine carboxypeptidase